MSVLVVLFFLIAILYSSIGFGGGSGYLAILSTTDMPHEQMRFTALCCNILVVSYSSFAFIKMGVFKRNKIFPLVIFSIPMSMVGGYISLPAKPFFIMLGITLLLAAILMLFQLNKVDQNSKVQKLSWLKSTGGTAVVGGFIGFISGLVGIGGGIFLAPLLHLCHWDQPKQIAAAASFFILVNSAAGLMGQLWHHAVPIPLSELSMMLLAVLLGSIIGTSLTIRWMKASWIKGLTAVLVLVAAIRILVLNIG